jgi:hypothetical protein
MASVGFERPYADCGLAERQSLGDLLRRDVLPDQQPVGEVVPERCDVVWVAFVLGRRQRRPPHQDLGAPSSGLALDCAKANRPVEAMMSTLVRSFEKAEVDCVEGRQRRAETIDALHPLQA